MKKVLAVIVMAFSLLLAIAGVGGIVGNWIVNNTLTDTSLRLLERADKSLTNTSTALQTIDGELANIQEGINVVEETAVAAGEYFVENPVVVDSVLLILDADVAPAVNDLRNTIIGIRDTLVSVQNTMDAMNSIPFVGTDDYVPEETLPSRLLASMTDVATAVEELRTGIRQTKEDVAIETLTAMGKRTTRVTNGVNQIQQLVQGLDSWTADTQTGVRNLIDKLPFWFDLASILLTIVLLWFIASQVIFFILGLSLFKEENLFSRWL